MTAVRHVEVGTASGSTITVRRRSVNADRPQGLVLDADHDLEVNGVTAQRIVLWSDTAPTEVAITTTAAGTIRFWNVWRDDELVQAWQGGARIDVDDAGDDLGLACHDGHRDRGVDLDVRISFDRAWTQPDAAPGEPA